MKVLVGLARGVLPFAMFATLLVSYADASASRLPVESLDVVTASGAHHFKVEIADTDATREQGLMFRKSLAEDRGAPPPDREVIRLEQVAWPASHLRQR